MAETFASLTARVHAQDPTITPEELEGLIACRIKESVDNLLKEIVTGSDTISLRQAIKDRFNLPCRIALATSLYIKVADADDEQKNPDVPFKEAILAIMEKDFSIIPPEEILRMTSRAVNDYCDYLLEAGIFSNVEFVKLAGYFLEKFGECITVLVRYPAVLHFGQSRPAATPSVYERPGLYL